MALARTQEHAHVCVRARACLAACLTHQLETKREQSWEVFVLLTILSNNPYLHPPSLRLIPESRGYALIMASPAGQRRGRRTWGIIHCVTGAVRPQQTRSPVDEDTGRAPLPRTLALRLVPLPLPSLKAASQLLLPLEVKGCVVESRLAPYQYPRHSNYPLPPLPPKGPPCAAWFQRSDGRGDHVKVLGKHFFSTFPPFDATLLIKCDDWV